MNIREIEKECNALPIALGYLKMRDYLTSIRPGGDAGERYAVVRVDLIHTVTKTILTHKP